MIEQLSSSMGMPWIVQGLNSKKKRGVLWSRYSRKGLYRSVDIDYLSSWGDIRNGQISTLQGD